MLQLINHFQPGLLGLVQFALIGLIEISYEWNIKTTECRVDYWFSGSVFPPSLLILKGFCFPFSSRLLTFIRCTLQVFPSPCHPPLNPSLFLPPPPFFLTLYPSVARYYFGIMIVCYVVSQLWVIRSNIISKAINGRQYLCVFYSLYFFFSLLPEHINKLTFYPYRLKLNYIQGSAAISHGAE